LGRRKNRNPLPARPHQPQKIIALIVTAAAILGGLGGFKSGLVDTVTLYCAHGGYLVCRLTPAP